MCVSTNDAPRDRQVRTAVRASLWCPRIGTLFFRMISQSIKLVGDRQEGARVQFVARSAVDNSKIYMYEGGKGSNLVCRIDR